MSEFLCNHAFQRGVVVLWAFVLKWDRRYNYSSLKSVVADKQRATAMVGIVGVADGNNCQTVIVVDGLDPTDDVVEVCCWCDADFCMVVLLGLSKFHMNSWCCFLQVVLWPSSHSEALDLVKVGQGDPEQVYTLRHVKVIMHVNVAVLQCSQHALEVEL